MRFTGTSSVAFSDHEQELVKRAFANRRLPKGCCPICDTANWSIVHGVVELELCDVAELLHDSRSETSSSVHAIAIKCEHCGNIQLLELESLGLVVTSIDSLILRDR